MGNRQVSLLLVEDDEEDKFLTVEALRDIDGTDYAITWVTTADAAAHELETGAYDVALLDFRLGAQTGIEVLEANTTDTPCILLTGQRDRETDLAAMRAGAADYIVKADLGSTDLERTIRYAIDRAEDVRSVRESELRFRAVVEAATDAILLINDAGSLITWNTAALTLFGLTGDDARTNTLMDLVGQPNTEGVTDVVALAELDDLQGRHADGSVFPVALTVSSWSGGSGRLWSAIVRDVTRQQAMETQLVHQAFHDPLTGLANRTLFASRVEQQISQTSGRPGQVAVIFLDLDDFKRINDSFGHEMGDELLLAVSKRLLGCVRPNETAARLGGDEFAILVDNSDDHLAAFQVAQKVMRSMTASFTVRNRSMAISCSIGIAFASERSTTYSDLLRDADLAMYAAKASGKGCIELFDDSMHSAILERLDLEVDLLAAVEREEIVPHFQPILELSSGRIKGFEALARWNHPVRGLLLPSGFIAIAESNGSIIQMGTQILRSACFQIKQWQNQFPQHGGLTVSVNVSGRQFEDPATVDVIERALIDSGLHPSCLIVEITESLVVDRNGLPNDHLRRIAALGVGIAIDDFGTGYSSLSYLQDLPLSILKVDRSFVNRSHEDRGGALVHAIVAMSHGLGLTTIAEGIETSDQLHTLHAVGCTFGQGYLFARPLTPCDATAFLAATHSWAELGAVGSG